MFYMLRKVLNYLVSESGQVPSSPPDTSGSVSSPSSPGEGTSTDSIGSGRDSSSTKDSTPKEEHFIDPSKLPEELKPHWRRMHRAYNKRLEAIRDIQNKKSEIDKFYSDPNFAREIISRWVGQYGYKLTPAQERAAVAQAQQPQAASQKQPDQRMIAAIQQQLDPSLHWLAPALANAISAITGEQGQSYDAQMRKYVEPLYQQQSQQQLAQRGAEYDRLAEGLSNIAPGWEEHEADMSQLVDFLSSNALSHPRFGSKLQVLYNAVSGNAAATASAVKRMQGAVRNKGVGASGAPRTRSNLQERIQKAPNMRQAWQLAIDNAMQGQTE